MLAAATLCMKSEEAPECKWRFRTGDVTFEQRLLEILYNLAPPQVRGDTTLQALGAGGAASPRLRISCRDRFRMAQDRGRAKVHLQSFSL